MYINGKVENADKENHKIQGIIAERQWRRRQCLTPKRELIVGEPYEAKVSRTVRSGGKGRDNIKALPITHKILKIILRATMLRGD